MVRDKEYIGIAWIYTPDRGPAVNMTSVTTPWAAVTTVIVLAGTATNTAGVGSGTGIAGFVSRHHCAYDESGEPDAEKSGPHLDRHSQFDVDKECDTDDPCERDCEHEDEYHDPSDANTDFSRDLIHGLDVRPDDDFWDVIF